MGRLLITICCVLVCAATPARAQVFEHMLGHNRLDIQRMMQRYEGYLLLSESYQKDILVYQLSAEYALYNKFLFNEAGRCTTSHLIGPLMMEETLMGIFEKDGWDRDKRNWNEKGVRRYKKSHYLTRIERDEERRLVSFITIVNYEPAE
jgi:hypothetical protein